MCNSLQKICCVSINLCMCTLYLNILIFFKMLTYVSVLKFLIYGCEMLVQILFRL